MDGIAMDGKRIFLVRPRLRNRYYSVFIVGVVFLSCVSLGFISLRGTAYIPPSGQMGSGGLPDIYLKHEQSTYQLADMPEHGRVNINVNDNIQEIIDHHLSIKHFLVHPGTYNLTAPLKLRRPLVLHGVDAERTILVGSGTGNVIEITGDDVEIAKFTITNGGDNFSAGIEVDLIRNQGCRILQNRFINNSGCGVILYGSLECVVASNTFINNFDGVVLTWDQPSGMGSRLNTVSFNVFSNTKRYGVSIQHPVHYSGGCLENNISNNVIVSTNYSNLGTGIYLEGGFQNTVTQNILLANNRYGIHLSNTKLNTIVGNVLSTNKIGIKIDDSGSRDNRLYHNDFYVHFITHAEDNGVNNVWYDAVKEEGNYWHGRGLYPDIIQDIYYLHAPHSPPSTVYIDTAFDNSTVGWGYNCFSKIQAGIDVVAEQGTVYVASGTYNENILINKTLSLIGENKATTIINGQMNATVVIVSADGVTLSGFTIIRQAGISIFLSGILLKCNHTTITDNILTKNGHGILLGTSYSNNIITGNVITNNAKGITSSESSSVNTITGNTINSNEWGIYLEFSSDNTITENTISNNRKAGIVLISSSDKTSIRNRIYHNNFNNFHNKNLINFTGAEINFWNHTNPLIGGNYWSDWEDNIGYPQTYTIKLPNNIDYYPLHVPFGSEEPDWSGVPYPDGPLIIIENPLPDSIVYTTTPVIQASYSAPDGINITSIKMTINDTDVTNNATITNQSISYKPQENLTYTVHTILLRVSDMLGNTSTAQWSFTVNNSEFHVEQDIENLTAGDETEIFLDPNDTCIVRINLTAKRDLPAVKISVARLREKPPNTSEKQQEIMVYEFLDIQLKQNNVAVKEQDLEEIKILFRVKKTWIQEYTIDPATITFVRHHQNNWENLTTHYVQEDDEYVFYETTTPGFSVFAVVGNQVTEVQTYTTEMPRIPWSVILAIIVISTFVLIVILFKAGYIYTEKDSQTEENDKNKQP